MITQNQRLSLILISVPVFLLIQFTAMQFSSEVNLTTSDFVVMAILLLCAGLSCEFVLRKVKTTRNRLVLLAVVLGFFFLIYAEMAVGIFGTPFAGS